MKMVQKIVTPMTIATIILLPLPPCFDTVAYMVPQAILCALLLILPLCCDHDGILDAVVSERDEMS